ncbi:dynein axonemal assembly factor 6 [Uranotaenia lowii]|uniref:dynein axonemal assembly factor 6 n=1 Tax=Uranotaenia lowii TaxID=190385 RepID=UPI0024786963|nr:dynein axonemal assembly factor 6 [Uranotaenia lowii]
MSLLTVENIKQIQKLFNPDNEDSDSDQGEERPGTGANQLGPGSIGEPKRAKPKKKTLGDPEEHVKASSYAPLKETSNEEPKTLEEWEKQQEIECSNFLETRPRPEYKISYKQTLATEDLFLQMGGKTPSSCSCESMVVEVFLTGETVGIQHIDLAVEEQQIIVQSPKYYLKLALPHAIDPDKGNAAWLSDEKILKLTLKMVREFDYVNF